MISDDVLAAAALSRGLATAKQVDDARARVAALRQGGVQSDLLGALAAALAPAAVAELRALARGEAADASATIVAPTLEPTTPGPPGDARAPGPLRGMPAPGDVVGAYVVERELGRGGMGVVYAARHELLGRRVALKLRLPGEPKADERFLREAQAAASLRHPAIVTVHDAGRDATGRLWMAMDLVEGEALDRRLAQGPEAGPGPTGPLGVREAALLAARVARGLEHAHARGVLHRDLKPSNILVQAGGAPLIVDFGLAKVVTGAEALTLAGEVLGTPAYMAPEQANAQPVDARADVWSLGVTLYHALVGQPPFHGATVLVLLAAVMRAAVAPPSTRRNDVPLALDAIVLRALSKQPEDRQPTAAALADELERWLAADAAARPEAVLEDLANAWTRTLAGADPATADVQLTYRPPGAPPVSPTVVFLPQMLGTSQPSTSGASPYELKDVLGKGGMGIVYRARQRSLGREVAVKKVLDDAARERFLAEAMVTGRLEHPNVVTVHDLGVADTGELLMAMKLVEGTSWVRLLHPRTDGDRARAARLGLVDHLRTLLAVCNAVAYAHSRGIAHCDLKPENVMIGEFGEVSVMDWGLAVDIRGAGPDPGEGALPHRSSIRGPCGTPAYMAPELANGEGDAIGAATDVYLLGATLHELLSGAPPHRGAGLLQVVLAAATAAPPELGPEVPAELRDICRRAMASAPADRFTSALALRDALAAYLEHRESDLIASAAGERLTRARTGERDAAYADLAAAVAGYEQALVLWGGNTTARKGAQAARLAYALVALQHGDLGLAQAQLASADASDPAATALARELQEAHAVRERARRHAQRLRVGLAAALVTLVAALSTGYLLVSRARDRALASEADARRERDAAEEARRRAQTLLAHGLVSEADALAGLHRFREARERLARSATLFTGLGLDARPARLGSWATQLGARAPLVEARGHAGPARGVAFVGTTVCSVGDDGTLRTWDAATGRARGVVAAHEGPAVGVALSPAAPLVVTAGKDGRVRLWDPATWREARAIDAGFVPTCVTFSGSGRSVVATAPDGALRFWSVEDGRVLVSIATDVAPTHALAVSPEGYAFSAEPDGRIAYRETRDKAAFFRLEGPTAAVAALVHARTRPLLVAAGRDGAAWLWERYEAGPNGLSRRALRAQGGALSAVTFVPGERLLVTAGVDGVVRVWDLTREVVVCEAWCGSAVLALSVSPAGDRVAAATQSGAIALWDLGLAEVELTGAERPREALSLRTSSPPPLSLAPPPVWTSAALSSDGALAATGAQDGRVVVWEPGAGLPLLTLEGHRAPVTELAFTPDGALVSISADGVARAWDLKEERPSASLESGSPGVAAIAPGAALVALVAQDGAVRVWPLKGDARSLPADGPAVAATFLPDGARLLVSGGGRFRVRDMTTGATTLAFDAPDATCLAVSQSGVHALAGHADGVVRGWHLLWDLERALESVTLRGHAGPVTRVAFAAAELASSAGNDGTWRLWDLAREDGPQELRAFARHGDGVQGLALARGADLALTASSDGAIVWDLAAGDLAPALDPEAPPAEVGRALAAAGSIRAAVDLLEGARATAALTIDDELTLVRGHWELGRPGPALAAARRVPGAALPLELTRRALARAAAETGTRVAHALDGATALAFAPDGRTLAVGGGDGRIALVDPALGRELHAFAAHGSEVRRLAWSPDGRWLASGEHHRSVAVWEVRAAFTRRRELSVDAIPTALAFAADGRLVIATSRSVVLCDPTGADAPVALPGLPRMDGVALSPDGRTLFACGEGAIHVYDLVAARSRASLILDPRATKVAAVGDRLAVVALDGVLRVFDAATRRPLPIQPNEIDRCVALEAAGAERVAWVDEHGQARVWNVAHDLPLARCRVEPPVLSLAVAPDGASFAIGGLDGWATVFPVGAPP